MISPRRLRAKYTLCTNQKIYDKWHFALPGATAEKISLVQMLTHLEMVRTRTESPNILKYHPKRRREYSKKTFFYQTV